MAHRLSSITAQSLMKLSVESHGIDRILANVKILSAENGQVHGEFRVDGEMTNPMGTIHGAFQSLLLKTITNMAMLTHPNKPITVGNTANMYLTYYKAVAEGTECIITANAVRVGRNMGFANFTLAQKDSGELISQGTHAVYFQS